MKGTHEFNITVRLCWTDEQQPYDRVVQVEARPSKKAGWDTDVEQAVADAEKHVRKNVPRSRRHLVESAKAVRVEEVTR